MFLKIDLICSSIRSRWAEISASVNGGGSTGLARPGSDDQTRKAPADQVGLRKCDGPPRKTTVIDAGLPGCRMGNYFAPTIAAVVNGMTIFFYQEGLGSRGAEGHVHDIGLSYPADCRKR